MKRIRFRFRGVGGGRGHGRWRGRRTAEGFFGDLALNVRDVVLGRVPDVLDWVLVGRVRRQENRGDALYG